jgi:hypothetical protein
MSQSQAEYESRELTAAHRALAEVEHAPLATRKEAAVEFADVLRSPWLVAERVGWLLDGNYGYGPMLMAKRIVKSPRMNRAAVLTQLAAAFEWQCPPRMAAVAWKKLTTVEQNLLDQAVKKAIKDA